MLNKYTFEFDAFLLKTSLTTPYTTCYKLGFSVRRLGNHVTVHEFYLGLVLGSTLMEVKKKASRIK